MKVIKIGDVYVVVHPGLPGPQRATVVILTQEPGKHVGVQFEMVVDGAHDLDGRLPPGTGYWVHPQHLYTDKEFAEANEPRANYKVVDELVFDPATGKVV